MTAKRRARLLAPFLVLLALLATAGVAAAHPLGNFTISRYSAVTLGADTADVLYIVDMAEIPTFQTRQAMDSDADGTISSAEEAAYLAAEVPALAANLRLTAGGVALPLTPVAHTLTFPPGQGDLPTLRLEVQLSAALPAGGAALDIAYEDGNFADRLGWREIVINAGSGALLSASVPAADVSHQLRDYPADLLQAPLAVSRATARFAPGGATLDAGTTTTDPTTAAAATNSAVVATRFGQDKFADLLQRTLDTPAALAAALLVAVGLGAAHALTPGHGKTIVGAYLVGSRGTARHALFLGLTTTITHTAGVFALGFLVLFASRFVLPEKLYPWLGVLSGLLVVGIGLSILRGHVGHWLAHRHGDSHDHGPYHFHFGKGHSHDHGHSHGPDGHTHGDHAHDTHSAVAAPVVAAAVPRPALAFAGVVSAAPSTVVAHTHGNHAHGDHAHGDHAHGDHAHDHSHAGHDHHHEHEHRAHGDHAHDHAAAAPAEALKWRNLLALGISGGLLPCPSALILMLSAIALRQVGVGLVLILAFSIGLAGVLTGIGLIMVYAGRFLERLPVRHGTLTTRLLPMASATFITIAGVAITIKALAEAGVI